MTSGDGERPASLPETPANSSVDVAAASPAEVCYDSDDLLTNRRGGLPADRPAPSNGQAATPEAPEMACSGVEMAAADAVELSPGVEQATSHVPPAEALPEAPFSAEPATAEAVAASTPLQDAPPAQQAVAVLAPPPTLEERDALSEPWQVVGISLPVATATPQVDEQEQVSAPAQSVGTASAATPLDSAPAEAAAPQASANGLARHSAGTVEYPTVEGVDTPEATDIRVPVHEHAPAPADEIIEIAIPSSEITDRTMAGAATEPAVEVPAAIATEEVITPVAEPVAVQSAQLVTEPIVLADPDIPAVPPIDPPAPPLAAAPPPPPAAPPPEEGEEEGTTMTIIEHLEELRHRITISAISVVVGAVVGWFIVPHVVKYLEDSARKLGGKFYSPTILGPFGLELKLAFLIGIIIASPMVLFQIWGFIAPGLTRKEKRYALPFSLIGGALFAGGAVTGILIVPLAIQFLTHFFQVLDLEQLLDIDRYIMFIALIAVIFGITFELPIFMVGFSLLGIVNSRFFIQKFRIAIFVIYGVSMVITPGADLISPLVLGTFLVVLYWLGVLLIRVIGR